MSPAPRTPRSDRPGPDPLHLAFEVGAGRLPAGSAPPVLEAFAQRVVAAGRRLAQAPRCPAAALRRAEALFDPARARGLLARAAVLLRLVFDSHTAPALATRGAAAARLLRFETGTERLDLEVEALAGGRRRLRIAVSASPGSLPRAARVLVDGRRHRVALDAAGAGSLVLPASARRLTVVLLAGRRECARTPEVALDAP